MERLYRVVFLALFILGFVGAIASADSSDTFADLIHDIQLANEVDDINNGRWTQDTLDDHQDGLAKVEALFHPIENSESAIQ